MQGGMYDLGSRESKEGNKLGSLGKQTGFTNFPFCQQTAMNLVCLEKQERWCPVLGKVTGHRS